MNPNTKPTDSMALLTTIDPVSLTVAAHTSTWVPVQNYHTFAAVLMAGVLGASATIDFKIQQATDSSGSNAKDITGKSITQFVKASNDGNQAIINFRGDDLDTANSFTHVAMVVTDGTAASLGAAALFGCAAKFGPPVDASASPAIQLGAATVVQIV